MGRCRRALIAWCAALTLLACGPLAAEQDNGIDRLERFSANLDSLRARFEQSLLDAEGNAVQTSSGEVVLKRPGRFRWDYRLPYEQLIVADNKRLWIYDSDLQQVTVKELDNALGNAPIMLLSERRPLEEDFVIRSLGARDGLAWVELEPRVKDTDFARIVLGLGEQGMEVMQLQDNFGQATEIRFHDLQINVSVADALFEFVPPPGVDIIGKP